MLVTDQLRYTMACISFCVRSIEVNVYHHSSEYLLLRPAEVRISNRFEILRDKISCNLVNYPLYI